ncbi:ABC transporter permease [bacterium CG17_big_fil_post_rev_8_21_14_2_50_64_8]|nr:MAG: ABC transporter permease [bacterium CG17_big_fil_post_rev_8_21_14_2_50_64_8]PJA75002.1 MAG: ABC transporter permease [bacterium CG_4_9_14_3_um_filter_65_15]
MTEHPGLMCVARRELRRISERPIYPMLLVVLPLISFALLWIIFSAGTVHDLPMAVIDLDESPPSRRFVRMLDAIPSIAITHRVGSGLDAEELLLSGEIYGAVLIPDDLERNVLRGTTAVVTLYRNSQFMLPSGVIRRDVLATVATLSAGIELHQREARGDSPSQARARFEPIRTERHVLFNPWLNYIYFLVSSLLPAMLQIFIIVASVHAVGVELKDGTSRDWLDAAGGSVTRAVVGKLLPYTITYVIVALFMLSLILKFMGVPRNGDLPALIAGTLLFVFACQGLGTLLAASFANLRLATSAAAFIATPAFAFAGLTFPIDAMPPFASAWAMLLPLTHYLRLLVEQMVHGAPTSVSLPGLSALAGFAVLAPLLAQPRLARVLSDERFWGQK